jgi:hypothetical protein
VTRKYLLVALIFVGCTRTNPGFFGAAEQPDLAVAGSFDLAGLDLAGLDLASAPRDLANPRDLSTRNDLAGNCGACFTPPDNFCIDSFTVRTFDFFGFCVGPDCEYNFADQDCPDGCDNGACITNSCSGIVCNKPPANFCLSSSRRVVYNPNGTCTNGVCDYDSVESDCVAPDHGTPTCASGVCGFRCEAGFVKSGNSCVPLTCSGMTPDKCGNTCVNLDTDESNCGFCGSFCEGTCNNGVCSQPWPNECMPVPPSFTTCNAYCASVGRTCSLSCSFNNNGSYGRYFDEACTQTNTFTTDPCSSTIQWSSSIKGIRCCCQ